MTQLVRFVDRVGSTDTLYDLSPGGGEFEVGDTSEAFPPPPLERALVSNPTRDGGSVAASLYGMRTIKLPLVYRAGYVDPSLVGTVARTNGVMLPEAVTSTGWQVLVSASGAATPSNESGQTAGKLGPMLDGRRLTFFRMLWNTISTGALSGTGLQFADGATQRIVAAPGSNTARVWVRTNAASRQVRLEVTYFDNAGAQLAANLGPDTAIPQGAWTELVFTSTAPALTNRALIKVINRAGPIHAVGDYLDMTALDHEPAASSGPYFSGATPAGSTPYVAAWTGTAQQSTSTLSWQSAQTQRRAATQRLMRVLQMERAVLEVRPDGVPESRWLSVYRSSDPDLTARLMNNEWAQLDVTIPADPFAYGPKHDLGNFALTIAGDLKQPIPASLIRGDVPAPTIVTYSDASIKTLFLASAPGSNLSLRCLKNLTESGGTIPAGTRTTASDATRINSDAERWNGGTTGNEYKIHSAVPLLANSNASAGCDPGLYRIFWLHDYNPAPGPSSDDIWRLSIARVVQASQTWRVARAPIGNTVIETSPTAQMPQLADMGVVEAPFQGRPTSGGFDPGLPIDVGQVDFWVKIDNRGATAQADMDFRSDAAIVLPAHWSQMMLQCGFNTSTVRRSISDPDTGLVITQDGSGTTNVTDVDPAFFVGQTPIVDPTQDIMLYGFKMLQGTALLPWGYTGPTSIEVTVGLAYWPRYLTVL